MQIRRTTITTARALLVVGILAAAITPSNAPAATAINGPLHTSGNKIYDAGNQQVTLRGVNVDSLMSYPYVAGSKLFPATFAAMKSWGINAVRLALGEQFWVSNDCQYVPAYANTVDWAVNQVTSRGMVAILDLHWNAPIPCLQAQQQKMADQGSITFWSEVAHRYKDNPLVAFDLYNEPHDIDWGVWRNGGFVWDAIPWQAAGMQQLYDAVRQHGAANLVFVSGNNWANSPVPDDKLITGNNVVYAVHYYTCPNDPPPSCQQPTLQELLAGSFQPRNPYDPSPGLNPWSSFLQQHPVMINEFGWPDPGNGTYNQNVISWAETHGIGWLAYSWQTTSTKWSLLDDTATFTPSVAGVPIKDGVARNP